MRTFLITLAVLSALACSETDNPEYAGGPLPIVDTERALAYPDGPYGSDEGDTVPNWRFASLDGEAVDLQNIRASTTARYLVLLPSAEWMESARVMLQRAFELAEDRDDVLFVSAVFEDDGRAAANPNDAQLWQQTHAIDWLVVAEEDGQFRLAWRDSMRPAVLVDLDSMRRLGLADRPAIGDVLAP